MADVQACVVQFEAITTTGNQTIAHATTTFTAKLVRFFTVASDALGTTDAAHMEVGAADGTNQYAHGARAEHNVGTSNTQRIGYDDHCIALVSTTASTAFATATWVNFTLSGGKTAVTINWDDATTGGTELFAVMYGGADFNADVGHIGLGTGTSAIDVTLSYDPDIVVFTGTTDNFTTSGNPGNFGSFVYGVARDLAGTTTQRVFGAVDRDNRASTELRTILKNNAAGVQVTSNGTGIDYSLSAGAHTTGTGFSVTPSSSAGNDDIGYIAMDLGGKQFVLGRYQTPTSTGVDTATETGIDFDYLELLMTGQTETAGTTNGQDAAHDTYGIYFTDGTDEGSVAYANESAAGTTNSERNISTSLVLHEDDGTAKFAATIDQMAAGWALNFSATDTGASRDFFYWGFGELSGATFNLTATDSLALADVSSETATFVETLAEALVLSDTSSETATFVETLSESFVLAEDSSEIATFPETLTEALALADTATSVATFARAVAEALTFADTSEGSTAIAKSAIDSILLTDTSSEVATFARTLSEVLAFSDSADIATKTIGKILVETLTLTDTAAGQLAAFAKTATDALSLVDTSTAQRAVAGVLLETLNLLDTSATVNNTFNRTLVSMLHLVDVATAEGGEEIVAAARGGLSLSQAKMRRLERLQLLRRDDEEVINLIMGLFK